MPDNDKSTLINHFIGEYKFHVKENNQDPVNYGFFFNQDDFLYSRAINGKLIHFELRDEYDKIVARLSVHIHNNIASSPWRAPFGSIECMGNIETGILIKYLREVLEMVTSLEIREFRIIHYPEFYKPEISEKIHDAYTSINFKTECREINQHIIVGQIPFSKMISYAQRKRLNKCLRHGFHAQIEDKNSLAEAYELLIDSRERKNYPVTMTLNELTEMFLRHPSRYMLFSVRDGSRMIAMAISIRISRDIVYNFYHADLEEYGSFSPTVLAVGSVYDYCQNEDIQYIDLGISSLDGKLNEGIYKFKKGLGAIEGAKIKYQWLN